MGTHFKHGVRMDVTPQPNGYSKVRLSGAVHEEFHFFAKESGAARDRLETLAKDYEAEGYTIIGRGLRELARLFVMEEAE